MTVPYSFGTATSAIPLSQLDSNFNTPITLGNTAIQLGNTVTTLNNMTLANVTISSGNVTLTNVSVTTANVATANIATSIITSSETLSYGTANGVAYLNGSKVLTTGSALTFDGTNLGLGGSANNYGANITYQSVYGSTAAGLDFYNGATRNGFVSATSSDVNFGALTNIPVRFHQNGSEQMRLTSTGLGIGTSSPGVKLDVAAASGVVRVTSTTGTNNVYYQASNTGGGLYMGRDDSDGGSFYSGSPAYGAIFLSTGAYPMAFAIDSVERARLDSSGNLGLGVTPSAWSGMRALQINAYGSAIAAWNSNRNTYILSNAYYDAAFKFSTTATASAVYYNASGETGVHSWHTAGSPASRTAGDPISFTQAMTLDASGNLGLDVTNPGARLDVYSPSTTAATPIAYFGKALNSTATSNILVSFLINSGGTGSGNIVANGANQAAFATSSDARIKENISNIEPQLDKIMALRPVEFDYIESEGGGHQIGFIAQEMEDVYADSVGEREDGMKMISGWSRTEARLVKALQEMKAIIDEQAARIAALEAK